VVGRVRVGGGASSNGTTGTGSARTISIRIASFGHAWTQPGASPSARRPWHMSHFRTMPRAGEYCGTS
jgi:hypothetical protein